MTRKEREAARRHALMYFKRAGIVLTPEEKQRFRIGDFGLDDYEKLGLGILVYVNTPRVCAKELVLEPRQTCAQHRHPRVRGKLGKEETFRCRWGTFYLYVPGKPTANPKAKPPASRQKYFTVFHEVVLKPGQQYTLKPNTWHWFQAGSKGAVVSEFSTTSTDQYDEFRDPDIPRRVRRRRMS